jgi:hypothetical protein
MSSFILQQRAVECGQKRVGIGRAKCQHRRCFSTDCGIAPYRCALSGLADPNLLIASPNLTLATHTADLPCGLDRLAGRTIELPSRFPPDAEALRYHRARVFQQR